MTGFYVVRDEDGDIVAVLVSASEARRRGVLCDHEDDPRTCTACKVEMQPYGLAAVDDAAEDLAFDASRERAAVRRVYRD